MSGQLAGLWTWLPCTTLQGLDHIHPSAPSGRVVGCYQVTPQSPEPQQRGQGQARPSQSCGGGQWTCRLSRPPPPRPHTPHCDRRACAGYVQGKNSLCLKSCLLRDGAQRPRLLQVGVPQADKTHLCRSVRLLVNSLWPRTLKGTKPKTSPKSPKEL